MTGLENIRALLVTLMSEGSIAKGRCSGAFLRFVRPLSDSGVIVEQRSGAGRCMVVSDSDALQRFYRDSFPQDSVPPDVLSRIAGVAEFRNSKHYVNDTPEVVSVRVWSNDSLTFDGAHLDAVAMTRQHGVFSFLLQFPSLYHLHGNIALIENPAVFACCEKLNLGVGAAVLARGRVSTALFQWLTDVQDSSYELVHLPDYDPVGLSEFLRLRKVLGKAVRLYLPPNIGELFAKYSNRQLLERPHNQALLTRMRACDVPEVRQVVALIDQHNAALEQEALLA